VSHSSYNEICKLKSCTLKIIDRHTLSPEKKILIGVDALASINPEMLDDSYVYVHCSFPIPSPGFLIRIWKTTFLNDCHSSAKSSALPKSCTLFDLAEEISQPGGFLVKGIARNKIDVYRIILQD